MGSWLLSYPNFYICRLEKEPLFFFKLKLNLKSFKLNDNRECLFSKIVIDRIKWP